MFISIARDGRLALREVEDFKRLHIEPESTMSVEDATKALAPIAVRADSDFWVGVEDLKALSGRVGDAIWEGNFAAMIASVEKFGWLSADRRRVRCHVKSK